MNEEMVNDMLSLNKEVDLEELKRKAIERATEDAMEEIEEDKNKEPVKVKFFRSYARSGDALPELEKQVNAFLRTKDSWYVEDVKFQVARNFLVGTTLGEFEEVGYAMVAYTDER